MAIADVPECLGSVWIAYEPCRRLIVGFDGTVNGEEFSQTVRMNATILQRRLSEFKASFAQQFRDCPPLEALGTPVNLPIPITTD